MITLDKWRYERIVSELIDGKDIRIIAERFSRDRVFYFHVLRDISSGERSPNFKLLRKIAEKRRVSTDFIIEQARLVVNYTIPNYQSDAPDYYKTLGVDREAGDEEIRRNWIELMKSNHPDLAGAEASEKAKLINEAYGVLGNQEKREAYDRKFLPPVPVLVPTFDLQKNVYIGAPIVVVILIALIYAAGSGLIFKSQEEKEQMARVIEQPSLPNHVYRGDTLAERAEKLEQSVKIEEEVIDYDLLSSGEEMDKRVPLAAAEKNLPEAAPEKPAEKNAEARPESEEAEPAGEIIAAAPGAGNPAQGEAMVPIVNLPESRVSPEIVGGIAVAEATDAPAPTEIPHRAEPESRAEIADAEKKETAPAEEVKVAEATDAPAPTEIPRRAVEPEKPAELAAAPEPEKAPEKQAEAKPRLEDGKYYTVSSGDSLWTIARKFDTTTDKIKRLNNLDESKINIGDRLVVSGEPPPVTAKAKAPETAAVKAGPVKSTPAKEIKTAARQAEPVTPQVKGAPADVFDPGPSTTAIAHGTSVMRRPEPVPAGPDKSTLYGFVTEYITAYRGKDLPRLKTLFSSGAVENGVDFATVMKKYDSSFSSIDILNYDVKVKRALVQNDFGFVRGDFFVTYKDARTGALKSSKGNINWKLAWKDASWKIIELNYRIETSGGADG
ncbi:MAG TPA: DnaJ domain-containing protein [Thermodesulfobacteriota bacterium]|nr:DnaJ domain-containing protein [Thermodesulfobacteriota bacterium]